MTRSYILGALGTDWTETEELFRASLATDVQLLEDVNNSILHNNGKMLRPLLSLCMARACGCTDAAESHKLAAAVELLHNATLLHDDVADLAEERRGRPTVNSIYGPVPAVLVGDFWLASAIGLVSESKHYRQLSEAFAKTVKDLVEGEMLQQQKAFSSDTTEEDCLRIIYCKTGSLFELACSMAVSVGGCPQEYRELASAYGTAIGYAFQIKDDILDYVGKDLGKPVGIDIREKKITLPLIGAMKNSGAEDEIRRLVAGIDSNPENPEKIHTFVLENGGIGYAEKRLEDYIAQACKAVSVLPGSEFKDILIGLAEYNALRER